ncbi:MAG: hypothetical protein V9G18_00385 [Albidovulum sp.]
MRRSSTAAAASAVIAAVALMAGAPAAEAKIYIPCTGDRLVTILEIPKEKQPAGEKIDLGYLFPGCFGEGEWVGIAGHDSYHKLDEQTRRALLTRAGLEELPPTPSRFSYPFQALLIEVVTVGVFALFGIWGLLKKMVRG